MKSPIDDKARYWQSMLEKWKDSGLSQMAFSMHEGIDSRRLAYWKKALKVTNYMKYGSLSVIFLDAKYYCS